MTRLKFLLILVGLSFAIGCGHSTLSGTSGDTNASFFELAGRLEAAMAIGSNNNRDTALADLARDAARAGDADITKRAIGAIRTDNLRDTTAAAAAVLLSSAGKLADATSVAKLIRTDNLRDQTLAKVAMGN
jgi:hypothetical protein